MAELRVEVRSKYPQIITPHGGRKQNPPLVYEEIAVYRIDLGDIDGASLADVWAEILSNPILESCSSSPCCHLFSAQPTIIAEISYKTGVTDNLGNIATEALKLHPALTHLSRLQVRSAKMLVFLAGNPEEIAALVESSLANPLLQRISYESYGRFIQGARFAPTIFASTPPANLPSPLRYFDLNIADNELAALSRNHCWALSLGELHHIRDHFARQETQARRRGQGLALQPSDIELEAIAQSWSEHCKHKIFAASISYQEAPENWDGPGPRLGSKTVDSLYRTYIKGATKYLAQHPPWNTALVSVFADNAGIVRFDPAVDVCIKVETHNSPSALDPYGGALTGILGVNRDILGCGLGAQPIANTDVFCLAPPDWPAAEARDALPLSLHHPSVILEGVHRGIKDGGNQSGIPTVNGALHFDRDFAGKPLIFCGSVGVLPQRLADGRASSEKPVRPGDHILCAGGRIGKDGIHGATMSSLALGEDSPSSAVQIGDPYTQKKLLDFTLAARDLGFYTCLTDNGAGGLSSSVGELAAHAPGARLDLARAGVKYPGLQPFELLISESQERMTYAVPPHRVADFLALAQQRGVEAWDLGEFTDSGEFEILYDGNLLASLNLEFLHHSLPQLALSAKFRGPDATIGWGSEERRPPHHCSLEFMLLTLLASPSIRSKEKLVRQYDHEVQGAVLQRPFVGPLQQGPSDAAVLSLAPYGGEANNAIVLACGLNPKLGRYDGYLMAQYAVDEAVRNIVASGGDPALTVLVDNFCWPDPLEDPQLLAQLVRCNEGLYAAALAFATPLVSGKDSMKNTLVGTYRSGRPAKIDVPPTLLITALARLADGNTRVSSEFKQAGDAIYVVGQPTTGLGCSEFSGYFLLDEPRYFPPPGASLATNRELYRALHRLMQEGRIASCHDISDGGLLVCLAECVLGGNLGCKLHLPRHLGLACSWSLWDYGFNEAAGRLVISVSTENRRKVEAVLAGFSGEYLGLVTEAPQFLLHGSGGDQPLLALSIADLNQAWKGGFDD